MFPVVSDVIGVWRGLYHQTHTHSWSGQLTGSEVINRWPFALWHNYKPSAHQSVCKRHCCLSPAFPNPNPGFTASLQGADVFSALFVPLSCFFSHNLLLYLRLSFSPSLSLFHALPLCSWLVCNLFPTLTTRSLTENTRNTTASLALYNGVNLRQAAKHTTGSFSTQTHKKETRN